MCKFVCTYMHDYCSLHIEICGVPHVSYHMCVKLQLECTICPILSPVTALNTASNSSNYPFIVQSVADQGGRIPISLRRWYWRMKRYLFITCIGLCIIFLYAYKVIRVIKQTCNHQSNTLLSNNTTSGNSWATKIRCNGRFTTVTFI